MHVKCFIWKLLLFCVHPVIHICIRYVFDDCEGSMHCKNVCNTSLVRCENHNSSNTNFMFVRCLDHSQCLKNVCKWKDAKINVPSALVQLLYHSSTPVHFWRWWMIQASYKHKIDIAGIVCFTPFLRHVTYVFTMLGSFTIVKNVP